MWDFTCKEGGLSSANEGEEISAGPKFKDLSFTLVNL